MKNGALASQGSRQGMYQISDPINGKPSWTSNSRAIWYLLTEIWFIGDLENIGEDFGSIYTNDNDGGLDDTNNNGEDSDYGDNSDDGDRTFCSHSLKQVPNISNSSKSVVLSIFSFESLYYIKIESI